MKPENDDVYQKIDKFIEDIVGINKKYYGENFTSLSRILTAAGVTILHAGFGALECREYNERHADHDDRETAAHEGQIIDFSDLLKDIAKEQNNEKNNSEGA